MVKPLSLNEKLHFVVPIYGPDGDTVTAYVHSAPISKETFEAHFMLISKTFSAIHAEGLSIIAGPRVASIMLREIAKQMNDEAGAITLMNEIRRLTNVIMREQGGWNSYPFQDVVDTGRIDEEDIDEVTNGIVFFTVASRMHQRGNRKAFLTGAARLWGALISPLNFTAFVASHQTSAPASSTTNQPAPGESSVVF